MSATDQVSTPRPRSPGAFPVIATPLIGRADDVAAIKERITTQGGARLVTITGPAGIGKTRLGIAVASVFAETMDVYRVAFVGLDAARDGELVALAIARALGVAEIPDQPIVETLAHYLRGKRMLLLLDNVAPSGTVTAVVAALLMVRDLTVLVTSDAALDIAGEQVYRVPSLALPDPDFSLSSHRAIEYDAIRLFGERARAVRADFGITDENAHAVAEVCRALDGLPLAIELAAARGATAAPEAILDGLRGHIQTGARGLEAAIAWSYDLLPAPEQQLLARLSVFVGGCTRDAAYVVSGAEGDIEGELRALCDLNLIGHSEGSGGEQRFVLPRPIREFAAERLAASGEEAITRQRYASYYLTLAEQSELMLRGSEQLRWLDLLEDELDNIRAVLDAAFDSGNAALGLRVAGGMDRYWQYHARLAEGQRWLARGLVVEAPVPPAVRAKALGLAGWLARFNADRTDAARLLAESLALYRALDDRRGIAEVADTLGDLAHFNGDQEEALALHEKNLALRQDIGDRWGTAMSLNSLGWIALERGDHRRAALLLHQSLAIVRQLGDRRGIAMVLTGLGWAALDCDDARQAHVDMREALALFRDMGSKVDIGLALDGLGAVAGMQGAPEQAARLFGAAEALREAIGVDYAAITESHYARHQHAARARIDAARWAAAWGAGRALSMDQAIEEALRFSAP